MNFIVSPSVCLVILVLLPALLHGYPYNPDQSAINKDHQHHVETSESAHTRHPTSYPKKIPNFENTQDLSVINEDH